MTPPDVTIVMLVKNERPNLERSIPIILAQRADADFRLLVIDSGSTDGSVEFIETTGRDDPRVRLEVIAEGSFHHGRTRNLGAELAEGRYLAFLGGDALPVGRDWLETLMAPVRENPNGLVAASYGRQIPKEGTNAANRCRMLYNYGPESVIKRPGATLSTKDLYFFSSVNCCIDRDKVRGSLFDEDIPVNEDWTLSTRLIREGWWIAYSAEAVVEHSHNYSRLGIFRRSFDNGVLLKTLGMLGTRSSGATAEGIAYLRRGWGELAADGLRARLSFLSFFVASAIGVNLGLHYQLLPRSFSRRITPHGTVS